MNNTSQEPQLTKRKVGRPKGSVESSSSLMDKDLKGSLKLADMLRASIAEQVGIVKQELLEGKVNENRLKAIEAWTKTLKTLSDSVRDTTKAQDTKQSDPIAPSELDVQKLIEETIGRGNV